MWVRSIKRWIWVVAAVLTGASHGQRLEGVMSEPNSAPGAIEFDRTDSVLYMAMWPCEVDGTFIPGLAKWDGNTWEAINNTFDSIQCATYWIRELAWYEGSLFASGSFGSIGELGPGSEYLARWDGQEWNECGSPSTWPRLSKANGELWAVGWNHTIGNQGASNISKYENDDWYPFGTPLGSNNGVRCVAYYNGTFFVAGNFTQSPFTPNQDILYWDGAAWQMVGTGLGAQNSWINTMASFQGRLFVGGALLIGDGNPGQNLVVWDGQVWSDFYQDRLLCRNQVNDLQVIDGKLYIAGVFEFAGDNHYYNLLQYDGVDLCAVGKDLTMHGGKLAREVRGNSHEVYFSTDHEVFAGDTVNYLAKWVLNNGADTCIQAILGIPDPVAVETMLQAWFTADGNLTVLLPEGTTTTVTTIEIFDPRGRSVFTQRLAPGIPRVDLPIGDPGPGVYLGRLHGTPHRFKVLRQ
jgi:hypothetical protein